MVDRFEVSTVGDETTGFDVLAIAVADRKARPCCKVRYVLASGEERCIGRNEQGVGLRTGQERERLGHFLCISDPREQKGVTRLRCGCGCGPCLWLVQLVRGVEEDGGFCKLGKQ